MVDGCSMTCVKYLLFVFNLIFAISGIAIITIGAVIKSDYDKYFKFIEDDQFLSAPIILIVVGVIIFVVAFFGCCGAIKENRCMTLTFSILLLLIFILELAAGIAAYVMRDQVNQVVNDGMRKAMDNYGKHGYDGVTSTWNDVQTSLHCCGVKNASDWKGNANFSSGTDLPDSCCKVPHNGCGKGLMVSGEYWPQGCLAKLEKDIEDNIQIVTGVGIGFAIVQVLGVIFACCLANSIKRQYEAV